MRTIDVLSLLLVELAGFGLIGCTGNYIYEYPHTRVSIHAHPHSGERLNLDKIRSALSKRVHEQELDLHYRRSDGQIVADHDNAFSSSPTLTSIIDAILAHRGTASTVQNDGRQFMLVLEPKQPENDEEGNVQQLLEGTFTVLQRYAPYFSTAVGRFGAPRGITVVITGSLAQTFYQQYQGRGLNRLAVVEEHNYAGEITDRSPAQNPRLPFQWTALKYGDSSGELRGMVNARHDSGYNVRAWFDDDGDDAVRVAFAAGADSLNCDFNQIDFCNGMLRSQQPRGPFPSLAARGDQVALSYRGNSSNSIYFATGTLGPQGPRFTRQINLTWLLAQTPQAIAPCVGLAPDGRIVEVYEGTAERRLWYVAGQFASLDRFLLFRGGEHRITLDNGSRRGSFPSVAFSPDGRMVVLYQGTSAPALFYTSGTLGGDGSYSATEFALTQGDARRGFTPSIAFDSSGHLIAVYRGTDNLRLFYVSGRLDPQGRIVGNEFRLTTPDEARRGFAPWVTVSRDGLWVIAYEGTDDAKIFFSYGTLGPDGLLVGVREAPLIDDKGVVVHGHHPTAAFDSSGRLTILYEGTNDGKLFFVSGPLDAVTGRIAGSERLLDMDFGDGT